MIIAKRKNTSFWKIKVNWPKKTAACPYSLSRNSIPKCFSNRNIPGISQNCLRFKSEIINEAVANTRTDIHLTSADSHPINLNMQFAICSLNILLEAIFDYYDENSFQEDTASYKHSLYLQCFQITNSVYLLSIVCMESLIHDTFSFLNQFHFSSA